MYICTFNAYLLTLHVMFMQVCCACSAEHVCRVWTLHVAKCNYSYIQCTYSAYNAYNADYAYNAHMQRMLRMLPTPPTAPMHGI